MYSSAEQKQSLANVFSDTECDMRFTSIDGKRGCMADVVEHTLLYYGYKYQYFNNIKYLWNMQLDTYVQVRHGKLDVADIPEELINTLHATIVIPYNIQQKKEAKRIMKGVHVGKKRRRLVAEATSEKALRAREAETERGVWTMYGFTQSECGSA